MAEAPLKSEAIKMPIPSLKLEAPAENKEHQISKPKMGFGLDLSKAKTI